MKMVEGQITSRQFGFNKHRSTTGNLMELVTYANMGLNSGAQVDIVLYTEFSKVFDRVIHNILLNKLMKFNIPLKLLLWTQSYLSNRHQFVKYRWAVSRQFVKYRSRLHCLFGCSTGQSHWPYTVFAFHK